MAGSDKDIKEIIQKNEMINAPEEKSKIKGDEKPQPRANKKESPKTQKSRRKKQDALEGKESKSARGTESEQETGKRGGGEKGGKSGGSGPGQGQSLQTGQTTVQFSSGGGIGNFGSLLALFASSSNLVRADVGGLRTLSNQSNNLNLRSDVQVTKGSLLGDGKEAQKVVLGGTVEMVSETSSKQFVLEGGTSSSHSKASVEDSLRNLFSGLSAQAGEGTAEQGKAATLTVFNTNLGGFSYIQSFNSSGAFLPPGLQFAFSNSPNPYTGVVSSYFTGLGLSHGSEYTYKIVGPILDLSGISTQSDPNYLKAITANFSDLNALGHHHVNISSPEFDGTPPVLVGATPTGLTITPTGDVIAFGLTAPISILVKATPVGGTAANELTFRIEGGPQVPVTSLSSAPAYPNTMFGLLDTSPNATLVTTGSLFSPTTPTTVIGSGSKILIQHTFEPIYDSNGSPIGGSVIDGLYSYTGLGNGVHTLYRMPSTTYVFPSNIVTEHIGTSAATMPTLPIYGNFDVAYIQDPSPFNITFGGNVLDVYGTKYGSGEALTLTASPVVPNTSYPTSTPVTGTTIVNMGGNTLAGFGINYGDVKTLNILGTGDGGPTLNFQGNLVYVDKSVGSTLYPHIQTLNMTEPLHNANLIFKGSILHGNLGPDIFYGDIQNLGDANQPGYHGLITGVTVTPDSNPLTITTAEGISITWGNNIYVGGKDANQSAVDNATNINTYHFTLLGDISQQPIMQGHALITDFDTTNDTLDFQITPALFKSLDMDHDKTISKQDLEDSGVLSFHPLNLASLETIDPLFRTFLVQNYPDQTINGTTISFSGGGTLSLVGISINSNDAIQHLTTEVNLTYLPVVALTPAEIGAPLASLTEPYIYGQGPGNFDRPYFNEIDKFFSYSLFAKYDPIPNLPDGVSINEYGTITVSTSTPYLVPLTITASTENPTTLVTDTSTSAPLLFGFLDAIMLDVDADSTFVASNTTPTILTGHLNSTLVGNRGNTLNDDSQSFDTFAVSAPGTTLTGTSPITLGASNLIVDTAGGAKAYGDYLALNFTVDGGNFISQNSPGAPGIIQNMSWTTDPNAIYVVGEGYGVTKSLNITVSSASDETIHLSLAFAHPDIDNSAQFIQNQLSFASQTLYGNGKLYGDMESINIDVNGGINDSFTRQPKRLAVSGSLDVSADVENNQFTFAPTNLHVYGDTATQETTLYGHVDKLEINTRYVPPKVITPTLTIDASANFSGNSFVFGDATLVGGQGKTVFKGDLSSFGDPFGFAVNPTLYSGFATGVTVTDTGHITMTDRNGNTITWGNDTYTGGVGANTYHFTIAQDLNGNPIMQGNDVITNFDIARDKIVLNLESNLFRSLGMQATDTQDTLKSLLAPKTNFGYYNNDAGGIAGVVLGFFGLGSITLSGANLNPILGLSTAFGMSLEIQSVGTAYTAPLLVDPAPAFGHVFANTVLADAFSSFIHAEPSSIRYVVDNVPFTTDSFGQNTYTVAPGVTFTSSGTLDFNVAGPLEFFMQVKISDGITIVTIPENFHIFAINDTDDSIDHDPSALVQGTVEEVEAYETSTPGNTIIGGGDDIVFNSTSNPTNPTTPITFASKLIYDVSAAGGHTAIGNVRNVIFTNSGTAAGLGLNGQTINFSSNLFNINASLGGGVWGNTQTISLIAALLATSATAEANINTNTLNFGSNNIWGSGTMWGNTQTIALTIFADTNLMSSTSTNIQGNAFTFDGNTITTTGASTVYGSDETIILKIMGGANSLGNNDADITANTFTFGVNTIHNDHAAPSTSYGDTKYLNLELIDPRFGTPSINDNVFTFGGSHITSGSGTIYGAVQAINLMVSGGLSSTGPIDATIQGNIFSFGPNTLTMLSSGTIYGNLKDLSLQIIDPTFPSSNPVGNGLIKNNIFNFGPNSAIGGTGPTNLYASLGTLVITNKESSAYTHAGTSEISGNQLTFKDSTLTSGGGATSFFGDIADLSQTAFILHRVTTSTSADGHVVVNDIYNNQITWGNDTFNTGAGSDTLTFSLLSLGGTHAVMEGNATINNYELIGAGREAITFKLAPELYKALDSYDKNIYFSGNPFDRVVDSSDHIYDARREFTHLTQEGSNLRIGFANGSVLLTNTSVVPTFIKYELAYTPEPVTAKISSIIPLILTTTGGIQDVFSNSLGTLQVHKYGNILDNYFDHVDIGNQGATYIVRDTFNDNVQLTLDSLPIAFRVNAFTSHDTHNPFQGIVEFSPWGSISVAPLITTNFFGNTPILFTPNLSPITVQAHDPHFSGNTPTITLMVGLFDDDTTQGHIGGGVVRTDPHDNASGTYKFSGDMIRPSYLPGEHAGEIMYGNGETFTIAPINQFNNYGYNGSNHFGGNILTNSNAGTVAYGDFKTINFNIFNDPVTPGTSSIPLRVQGTLEFGQNATYINGTSYGIAQSFVLDVESKVHDQTVTINNNNNSFATDAAIYQFNDIYFGQNINTNTVSFGTQVMYGTGTLYGILDSMEFNLVAGQNIGAIYPVLGFGLSQYDASAFVKNNNFNFASTNIAILDNNPNDTIGNDPSTIYSSINRLAIHTTSGVPVTNPADIPQGYSTATVFLDAQFSDNTFSFQDSIAIGGSSGTIFYPMINDLSQTPFWVNALDVSTRYINNTSHVSTAYNILQPGSSPFGGAISSYNTIIWPNNTLYLDVHKQASDAIHLSLMYATETVGTYPNTVTINTPIMQGNLTVYNFDPLMDKFVINLNPTLYNQLISNGPITSDSFHQLNNVSSVINPFPGSTGYGTTIYFDQFNGGGPSSEHGTILLAGYTGPTPWHNFTIATTLIGTANADTFSFTIPSNSGPDFSSFNGNIEISGFSTTGIRDNLEIILSPELYKTMSSEGLLSGSGRSLQGSVGVNQLTSNPLTGINTVVQGGDLTLQFVTNGIVSGSILLSNINLLNLSDLGPNLHVGYLLEEDPVAVSDPLTFNFWVPGGQFSSFTQFDHINGFHYNSLQFTLPKDLFVTITNDASLRTTLDSTLLAAQASRGGIGITHQAAQYASANGIITDTVLSFVDSTSGVPSGSITLHNYNLTDLGSLGTQLQTGYFQVGAAGVDTFSFMLPKPSINAPAYLTDFKQFNHITNFYISEDTLQLIMPASTYFHFSNTGTLQGDISLTALQSSIPSLYGHIHLSQTAAEFNASNGVPLDTHLQFTAAASPSLSDVTGEIVLHNVAITNLSDISTHLQFGSIQEGRENFSDTYTFFVPPETTSFAGFTHFDHITGANFSLVDSSADNIQIALPTSLFAALSSTGDLTGNVTAAALEAGTLDGRIKVIETPPQFGTSIVDSHLQFLNGTGNVAGEIVLHNVDLSDTGPTPHLEALGSHLQIGSLREGTSAVDTFTFTIPNIPGGQNNDFSGFQNFDHIIDFDTTNDNLVLSLPQALFDALKGSDNSVSVSELHAGVTTPTVSHVSDYITNHPSAPTQSTVDTIISFVSGTTVTGSITLHNVNTTLDGLPNLQIVAHA